MISAILALSLAYPWDLSDDYKDCKYLGQVSSAVMNLRQSGSPMHELMKDSDATDLIVIEAFKYPLEANKDKRKIVISEFSNRYQLLCYQL